MRVCMYAMLLLLIMCVMYVIYGCVRYACMCVMYVVYARCVRKYVCNVKYVCL